MVASFRQKVITAWNCSASKSALSRSKLNAWPRPVGPGVQGATLRRRVRLGDRGPRRVVLVEDLTPLGVDLVHLVAVVERVVAVQRAGSRPPAPACCAAARRGPWPARARRRPDSRRRPGRPRTAGSSRKSVAHLGVVPVEVGLLAGEEVAVPLTHRVRGSRPGRRSARSSPTAARTRPGRCRRGRCSGRGRPSPAAEARASTNQGCRSEVWFGHDVDDHLNVRARAPRRPGRRSRPGCPARARRCGSRRRRIHRRPAPRDRTG